MVAKWLGILVVPTLLAWRAPADVLDRSVPILRFPNAPLGSVVDEIGRSTGTTIVVAWNSLDKDLDRLRVDACFNQCRLRAALHRLFPANAQIYASGSTIHIGGQSAMPSNLRTYPIGDLARRVSPFFAPAGADYVRDLVTSLVRSDEWKDNGGSAGSLREFAGLLIVTATPETHQKLKIFLDKLRREMENPPDT